MTPKCEADAFCSIYRVLVVKLYFMWRTYVRSLLLGEQEPEPTGAYLALFLFILIDIVRTWAFFPHPPTLD